MVRDAYINVSNPQNQISYNITFLRLFLFYFLAMRHAGYPARDKTHTSEVEAQSLNNWATREVPSFPSCGITLTFICKQKIKAQFSCLNPLSPLAWSVLQ